MVKAKDFWNTLCSECGYRFFSGVAHSEFKSLYKTMDSDIMHYVPAVDETTALGIASGVSMAGHKSGIIIDTKFISDLIRATKFNKDFSIPVLIIGTEDSKLIKLKKIVKTLSDVKEFATQVERRSIPGLMVLEGLT